MIDAYKSFHILYITTHNLYLEDIYMLAKCNKYLYTRIWKNDKFWRKWKNDNYPHNEDDKSISLRNFCLRLYFLQKVSDVNPKAGYIIKREKDKCCILPVWSNNRKHHPETFVWGIFLETIEKLGFVGFDYDSDNMYGLEIDSVKKFPIKPSKGDIVRIVDYIYDRCDNSLFFDGDRLCVGHCIDSSTNVPYLGKDFVWPNNFNFYSDTNYKTCIIDKYHIKNFVNNINYGILPFYHNFKNINYNQNVNYTWSSSTYGKKLYCVIDNTTNKIYREKFIECIYKNMVCTCNDHGCINFPENGKYIPVCIKGNIISDEDIIYLDDEILFDMYDYDYMEIYDTD